MKITWGTSAAESAKGAPVVWDSSRTINPHCMVLGDSGVGKTFRLLRMIRDIYASTDGRVRIHVLDAHGDMLVDGASTVKFSESTDYGFNPLEVNPDHDFGGVRKRVQSFVSAINRTSHKLGPRQESVLRNILMDLYSFHGFKADDPASWVIRPPEIAPEQAPGRIYLEVPFEEKERAKAAGAQWDGVAKGWYVAEGGHEGALLRWGPKQYGRRHPTVLDALRFARKRLNAMFFGVNNATMHYLEDANRLAKTMLAKQMAAARRGEDIEGVEKLEKDIESAKTKFFDAIRGYLQSMRTGRELEDCIRYDSSDVLKSVVDRLENLNAIGIFRSTPPPFNPRSAIWHYDIKALSDEEKRLFVTFRLESIFARAIERGMSDRVVEVVVIDEADLYTSDDSDHILNKLVKEGRKFGISLILASQAPTHFSDNLLSGVAVRVVLGVDKFHWPVLTKKLGIEDRALNFVVPKRKGVVQMKNAGELQSRSHWVHLAN